MVADWSGLLEHPLDPQLQNIRLVENNSKEPTGTRENAN